MVALVVSRGFGDSAAGAGPQPARRPSGPVRGRPSRAPTGSAALRRAANLWRRRLWLHDWGRSRGHRSRRGHVATTASTTAAASATAGTSGRTEDNGGTPSSAPPPEPTRQPPEPTVTVARARRQLPPTRGASDDSSTHRNRSSHDFAKSSMRGMVEFDAERSRDGIGHFRGTMGESPVAPRPPRRRPGRTRAARRAPPPARRGARPAATAAAARRSRTCSRSAPWRCSPRSTGSTTGGATTCWRSRCPRSTASSAGTSATASRPSGRRGGSTSSAAPFPRSTGSSSPASDAPPTDDERARAAGARREEVAAATAPLVVPLEEDRLADDVDTLRAAEDRVAVARALRRLPPRERRIVALRFGEGLSQGGIAARPGSPRSMSRGSCAARCRRSGASSTRGTSARTRCRAGPCAVHSSACPARRRRPRGRIVIPTTRPVTAAASCCGCRLSCTRSSPMRPSARRQPQPAAHAAPRRRRRLGTAGRGRPASAALASHRPVREPRAGRDPRGRRDRARRRRDPLDGLSGTRTSTAGADVRSPRCGSGPSPPP